MKITDKWIYNKSLVIFFSMQTNIQSESRADLTII